MKPMARFAFLAASFLLASCGGGGKSESGLPGTAALPPAAVREAPQGITVSPRVQMTYYTIPPAVGGLTSDGSVALDLDGSVVFVGGRLLNGRFTAFPNVPPNLGPEQPYLLQYYSLGAIAVDGLRTVYSCEQYILSIGSPESSTFGAVIAIPFDRSGKFLTNEGELGFTPIAADGTTDSLNRYWALFNPTYLGNQPFVAIVSGARSSSPQWTFVNVGPVPADGLQNIGNAITRGSHGAMWVAITGTTDAIARVSDNATLNTFPVATGSNIQGLATDASGNVWFTDLGHNKIGRMNSNGSYVEFAIPTTNARPNRITRGGDGALWFTEAAANKVGRITTTGQITEYPIALKGGTAEGITGPVHGCDPRGCSARVVYVGYLPNTIIEVKESF